METTIYKSYLTKGTPISRKQLLNVGLRTKTIYQQIFGTLPEKQEQQEPLSLNYLGKNPKLVTFKVYVYPSEFETIIHNLIDDQVKQDQELALVE